MKVAYPPLLPPGRHKMTLTRLYEIAVEPYPASVSRSTHFAELQRLAADLAETNVCCELWIDGSNLTEKLEPGDIDLSVAGFAVDFDLLPAPIFANMLSMLNGGKKYSPVLDTYMVFRFLR